MGKNTRLKYTLSTKTKIKAKHFKYKESIG